MHPNAELVTRFYAAFAQRNAAGMHACYHRDVHFSDPVFPDLRGDDVRAMWDMLCTRGKDLTLTCSDVNADDVRGSARWVARYTFSATGRHITNHIAAEFTFRDGLIVRHRDQFSLYGWARQALGLTGLLLGWSRMVQSRVRTQAAASLRAWRARETAVPH